MKEWLQEIRNGNVSKVYLLTGDEPYLIRHTYESLKKELIGTDTWNMEVFTEENLPPADELRVLVNHLPFMGKRRVVILNETGVLKNAKYPLKDVLDVIPDTTTLLLKESEADARTASYKAVKKVACFIKETHPKPEERERWIIRFLKHYKKKIGNPAFRLLNSYLGDSMDEANQEILKLISYAGEETEITEEAVRFLVSRPLEDKIYNLTNAMFNDTEQAVWQVYQDFLKLQESPFRLISAITKELRKMYLTKRCMADGISREETASLISTERPMKPYAVQKIEERVKNLPESLLLSLWQTAVEREKELKQGKWLPESGLESLIVEIMERIKSFRKQSRRRSSPFQG